MIIKIYKLLKYSWINNLKYLFETQLVCILQHLETDLNSKCKLNFFGGPTTLYKIEKTFKSSGNAINIRFFDELFQPNAIDKDGVPQQKCDESWSLDNLTIRAISYKWLVKDLF